MLFYRGKVEVYNPEVICLPREEGRRSQLKLDGSLLQEALEKGLRETDNKCAVFAESFREEGESGRLVFGGIADETIDFSCQVDRFLETLGINASKPSFYECGFFTTKRALDTAERNRTIDDEDDVLKHFSLEELAFFFSHFRSLDMNEQVALEKSREDLYALAQKLMVRDSLCQELDRIFEGMPAEVICGHPVHYMIHAKRPETGRSASEVLVSSLASVGRLSGRRISRIDTDDLCRHEDKLESIYEMSIGCTIVFPLYDRSSEEGSELTGDLGSLHLICKMMKKYRNKVLTILEVERGDAKTERFLRESLGSIALVDIWEDILQGDSAKQFLKRLARENGIDPKDTLTERIEDPNKKWMPDELEREYDKWLDGYLRKEVYPQYGSFATSERMSAKDKPTGSAFQELEDLIGLENAKSVICRALDYYKARTLFHDSDRKMGSPAMHMVFTGNPGTAKTTVARLFARIMAENGVLSIGNLVEVGRGDLVGRYVGWTAKTVKAKFEEAKGSVLFIDEAYSLVDYHSGSYGDEAINTIVQEMENCREDTIVIFAGYPDKMEEFLSRNPGLRSRIAFHVPFEDYNANELYSIAEKMADAQGLRFAPGVEEKIIPILETESTQPEFGNGRFARNLVEKASMCQASRLVHCDVSSLTNDEICTLLPEDFEPFQVIRKPERRPIGFAV